MNQSISKDENKMKISELLYTNVQLSLESAAIYRGRCDPPCSILFPIRSGSGIGAAHGAVGKPRGVCTEAALSCRARARLMHHGRHRIALGILKISYIYRVCCGMCVHLHNLFALQNSHCGIVQNIEFRGRDLAENSPVIAVPCF